MRLGSKSLSRALLSTSNAFHGPLKMVFGNEEELSFRLFFQPTRHEKTTMSMETYREDRTLKARLEQQWLERAERKAAGTETEFGEWKRIR